MNREHLVLNLLSLKEFKKKKLLQIASIKKKSYFCTCSYSCVVFRISTFDSNLNKILYFRFSIGYPVVTLGFGFKSYVGYRMRQRRQREVQKGNEYYYQFLKEALPPGVREDAFNPHPSPKPCK